MIFFYHLLIELISLQAFSNAAFHENLAIWVASDDQPFTITEGDKFQRLIKLCNAKVEIPSADTIRNDILNLYNNYRTNMKNKLQVSKFYYCFIIINNIKFFIISIKECSRKIKFYFGLLDINEYCCLSWYNVPLYRY